MSLKTFDKYLATLRRPGTNLYNSASLLTELSGRLQDELETLRFFRISEIDAAFLDAGSDAFGDAVYRAFPSAGYDIEEACKCRALARWTSSVMHLMRALDVALLAFQKHMAVNQPKENWQQIIDQIESVIRSQGHKHPDHQWNSEASAYFRTLKDAWRNHAMHGKDRYNEERAVSIYENTRGFMRHLATRISE